MTAQPQSPSTQEIGILARAISMIEARDPTWRDALLSRHGSKPPYTVGVTGPPGSGKSSLVNALIAFVRASGQTVGVLAVDPTSQATGGALLGDRVRMYGHSLDLGVYIRSMGARGHLGGLSLATREAVRLVGAFGFETVILETVGVGQSELEVASLADTTIVVVNPEQGDEVQMLKAGILEIADIFVVNKSDLSGAKKTRQQIRQTLHLGVRRDWTPPIINTVATRSEGVEELMTATNQHREFLSQSGVGELRRQDQLRHEVADLAAERGRELTLRRLDRDVELHQRLMTDQLPDEIVDEVLGRRPS